MNKALTCAISFGIIYASFTHMPTHAYAQSKQGSWELKDVLNEVYISNPTLNAAREQFKATQELSPQAKSGWLPKIKAETSVYTTNVESSNFGSADGATTKDVTLSVDQPIWRGGITSAETARADSLITAEKHNLIQTEQLIFLQASTTYMDVIRDRALLELYKKNEALLLSELQSAWERVKIGDITQTDAQQAKSRLAHAKSERIRAQNNLDISNAEFEQITGINTPQKITIPYIDFKFPAKLADMFEIAENQNPEIIQVQYTHKASEHDIEATSRERFPQISGFASINRQYDPQPGVVDRAETDMLGVRATLALYQGGKTSSRIREAKSLAKRREYQIDQMTRQIKQEITSNFRSYEAAKNETENRKEEIEALESALKGVREEAKAGQRSVLDVLDADQETIDAKASLVEAQHNEIISQLTLAQSLGLLRAEKLELSAAAKTQ